MQVYSDPARSTDPYALPDVEVFHVSELVCNYNKQNLDHADEFTIIEPGWYWWTVSPGCLPDSPAYGPFETEEEATKNAQDYY